MKWSQLEDLLHRHGEDGAQENSSHDDRVDECAHFASLTLPNVLGCLDDAEGGDPSIAEGEEKHIHDLEPVLVKHPVCASYLESSEQEQD